MANNRMFLIHKPSGLGVMLGKRMGWGWYNAPQQEKLNAFYEYLSDVRAEERQDDFVIAMEDCTESGCFDNWRYTDREENGFRVFEYT